MAWIDDVGEHAGTVAGWIAAFAVGLLSFVKTGFGIRRAARDDHAGERQKNSDDVAADGATRVIRALLAEVDRLTKSVEALRDEVSRERQSRFLAEELANKLNGRVEVLEAKLAAMNGK